MKIELRVECYSGYKGEETPRAFYIGDRRCDVDEVIDRWLDPEHRYFKVTCGDGGLYILRHDIRSEIWELTFYEQGINID